MISCNLYPIDNIYVYVQCKLYCLILTGYKLITSSKYIQRSQQLQYLTEEFSSLKAYRVYNIKAVVRHYSYWTHAFSLFIFLHINIETFLVFSDFLLPISLLMQHLI